jgi:tetratricopeptide (TPR) repeat protein
VSKGTRIAAVISLLLVTLTAAVFYRVGSHPFASFDDNIYLTDNLDVRDGLTARGLSWAFTSTYALNWHPLTWISHMLDVQLFDMNPGPHHLTNLALHSTNTALLFLALRAMTGALWPAAFAAALFGVHPLHVESVAWLSERKDVLSTLFWMLTLLAWVQYARRPNAGRYLIVAGLFGLGLLAKPMLVTLPFVLLLLDFWPLGRMGSGRPSLRRGGALFLEKAPLLALTVAASVMTVIAQRAGGAVLSLQLVPLSSRVANSLVSWLRYIRKTVWPTNLAFFYPLDAQSIRTWQAWAAALLLGAITVGAVLLWKRRPYLAVGWLWYFGTLVPVIGIVQVGMQGMADHYTYVPLVGLFLAATWAITDLARTRRGVDTVLACGAAGVIATCAVAASFQVDRWRDEKSLMGNALAATSQNWVAENNLGVTLFHEGRIDEAITHYENAKRILPTYADAYYNMGLAYMAQGKREKAVEAFTRAAYLSPGDPDIPNSLGAVLVSLERHEEALQNFRRSARLKPDKDVAFTNMAIVLGRMGRSAEAAAASAEASRVQQQRRSAHPSAGTWWAAGGQR